MKKYSALVLALCLSFSLFAQSEGEQFLKKVEDSKSGNLVDAFGSFYQMAFKSITVDKKSLELNSTLFSLIKNYDENILMTKSRKSIVFLRNFQVNAKVNLDDKLNFNGYSGGITYAFLNKRDKGFIDIDNSTFSLHDTQLNGLITAEIGSIVIAENAAFLAAHGRAMNSAESQALADELTIVATAIKNGKTVERHLLPRYNAFKTALDARIAASPYFNALAGIANTDQTITLLTDLKADFIKELEKKPFWSFSAEGITDKDGKLNQAAVGTVFLVGNDFGELDIRAKYEYADTLNPSMPRHSFNGKLGYNFKLVTKNDKSYFELKLYSEYVKILKNELPDEEKETFLANADLRVRLTDNLWIPFSIKYDTENANFMGFLNVTYNFGI